MYRYEDVVLIVEKNSALYAFVTHPFTLGKTSIVHHKGINFTHSMSERLGAIEIVYTVYGDIKHLLTRCPAWLRNKFLSGIEKNIQHNESLPPELYPSHIRFLAAGSDAHHWWEIGDHIRIPAATDTFYAITHHNSRLVVRGRPPLTILQLLRSGLTTHYEWWIKFFVTVKALAVRSVYIKK